MTEAIGQVLGYAVGVAISPVPIVALILMLFSRAAVRNSVAFLVAWLLGLTAAGLVVLSLGLDSGGGGTSDSGVVALVIGAVFVFLAIRRWRNRPRDGEDPATPGWMDAVDDFSLTKSFGLGLLLTVANPKNVGLTIAAAAGISSADLQSGQDVLVLLIFVAIASITIIAPIACFLLARDWARSVLDSVKLWMIANNNTVMAVLFAVLGAKLLGDGIAGLG